MARLKRTAGQGEPEISYVPDGGPASGALNLLAGCVGVRSGDHVLIVAEPPGQGHYDDVVPGVVAREAERLGAVVSAITTPVIEDPKRFPRDVTRAMGGVDHVVFLNRIGDYARFVPLPGGATKTVCYALDAGMLGSPFATVPHELMTTLLKRLEAELFDAARWRITCPLGTDIAGTFNWPSRSGGTDDDFTVRLFPVTTFKPVPCDTARGVVALSRWLMPGGADKLGAGAVGFDGVVQAEVEEGKVRRLTGPGPGVDAVRRQYDRAAGELDVNRDRVHSWHAGVNPQTAYAPSADEAPGRWGGVSFGSPRYLHFHTCGDEPPGEIAWSLFYASVWIDGEPYWRDGELVWLQREDNRRLIDSYPGAACLLEPSRTIGL